LKIIVKEKEKYFDSCPAFLRHSRERGNPECVTPESTFTATREHWIPAFAGMTIGSLHLR
jgi:hypothetical protein